MCYDIHCFRVYDALVFSRGILNVNTVRSLSFINFGNNAVSSHIIGRRAIVVYHGSSCNQRSNCHRTAIGFVRNNNAGSRIGACLLRKGLDTGMQRVRRKNNNR